MARTQYCKTLFEMMKYSQGNLKKVFNKDHMGSDVGGVKKVIFYLFRSFLTIFQVFDGSPKSNKAHKHLSKVFKI